MQSLLTDLKWLRAKYENFICEKERGFSEQVKHLKDQLAQILEQNHP